MTTDDGGLTSVMQLSRVPASSPASGDCRGTVRALVVVWDHDHDDGGVVAAPAAL